MKKITIILFALICFSVFAQYGEYDTVMKLQTEQNISKRIEELLFPFVGKTVVVVDLSLKYPKLDKKIDIHVDGTSAEKDNKVRSSIIENELETLTNDRTTITSMNVVVYYKEELSVEKLDFIRENVTRWIGLKSGDNISVQQIASFPQIEEPEEPTEEAPTKEVKGISTSTTGTTSPFTMIIILAIGIILLIIILLILNGTFKKGINSISGSLEKIQTSESKGATNLRAKLSAGSFPNPTEILDQSSRKPLQVSLLKEDEVVDEYEMSFLEELSIENFTVLIKDEKPDDIAYVLSNLSVQFVDDFLTSFSEEANNVIEEMLRKNSKSKTEVKDIRTRLYNKFITLVKEEKFKVDGKDKLIRIINELPIDKSRELFDKINAINQEAAEEIRPRIFLRDDIIRLEDDIIKELIFDIDHDLLVMFLASVNGEINKKFLSNMSERAVEMFKEDIGYVGELTKEEKIDAVIKTIDAIRTILNYK